MRLINVVTLELQSFNDDDIPEYAILSHTWGADEVTYPDFVLIKKLKAVSESLNQSSTDERSTLMLNSMRMLLQSSLSFAASLDGAAERDLMARSGYTKIVQAAKSARDWDCDWIWIDTCCIDKTSSAELQEAINSMYRWYRQAKVCLVYLEDVAGPTVRNSWVHPDYAERAFKECRWITRGWKLQELLASAAGNFYFRDWTLMGDKSTFLVELSEATGDSNDVT